MAAPHLMSRICIAKSEREFGKAMAFLAVAIPICIIGLIYPFSYMSLIEGVSVEADVFPWVAKNLVPPALGAIGLSGVIAAAISTATSLFQQASATRSSDIIKTYFKPDMTEDELLKVSRISVIVIAILVFIGSNSPQIGPGCNHVRHFCILVLHVFHHGCHHLYWEYCGEMRQHRVHFGQWQYPYL